MYVNLRITTVTNFNQFKMDYKDNIHFVLFLTSEDFVSSLMCHTLYCNDWAKPKLQCIVALETDSDLPKQIPKMLSNTEQHMYKTNSENKSFQHNKYD